MGDGRWKQMFFFLAIQGQPDDDEMIVLVWNHPILSVLFTMATLRSSDFVVRRFNFREGFLKMGDLKWCKFGWFGVPPTLGNFHIYIYYMQSYIYIYLYLYLYFFLVWSPHLTVQDSATIPLPQVDGCSNMGIPRMGWFTFGTFV